ncbi:MAG: sulfatase [Deltaproteobacteria bacterium]|nr:sulfatase [Deltaproteobacteria bacterium]
MTTPYRDRFSQVFAGVAVAAAAAGLLDAARTLWAEGAEEPVAAALAILGFDAAAVLAAGTPIALLLALIAPAATADPRAAAGRLLRAAWPADPCERAEAGASLLVRGAAAGALVGLTYLAALAVFESVRTPTFAAAAVALLVLPIAAGVGVAARALASRARAAAARSPTVRGIVSPLLAIGLAATAVAGALALKGEAVRDVVSATDLGPWWIGAASVAAGLATTLAGRVARWPNAARTAVVSGLPAALLAAWVLVLAWVGHDNDTRLVVTSEGRLSPIAYRTLKTLLDVDGDDRLPFFGEGDCDAFDADRYSGAIEVPNNGRDEDCDGDDLDLSFPERKPRWDFPVPAVGPGRWNVVLLTVDALAPPHMSISGYHRPTSPFMDGLARSGVWFPFAYSQGPSTRLAIPAMWMSRYDSQIATPVAAKIPLEILPSNLTMAEVLKGAGYRTVAVLPAPFFRDWKGSTQGFDVVNAEAVDHYVKPVWHNGDKVTDAALGELARAAGTQPLFLWVHWYDTHGPYTPPPGGPDWGTSEEDVYDAEIAYTDGQIRRFVEGLWKALPEDRTILILAGDHGEAFDPAHPKRHHGYDLHSSVLHVPLLFRAPFLRPATVDMQVTTMDLLPTLVNLLGIKGSFAFEGTSLVPQIFGEPPDEQRVVFHQFFLNENVHHKKRTLQHVAARAWSLYLIHDLTNNTFQMYRYRTDPFESENLWARMPEAAAILKAELARFTARVTRMP